MDLKTIFNSIADMGNRCDYTDFHDWKFFAWFCGKILFAEVFIVFVVLLAELNGQRSLSDDVFHVVVRRSDRPPET